MLLTKYQEFASKLNQFLPKDRIVSNYSKRLAYGVDARFYRLVPQLVLMLDTEEEVVEVLKKAALSAVHLPT